MGGPECPHGVPNQNQYSFSSCPLTKPIRQSILLIIDKWAFLKPKRMAIQHAQIHWLSVIDLILSELVFTLKSKKDHWLGLLPISLIKTLLPWHIRYHWLSQKLCMQIWAKAIQFASPIGHSSDTCSRHYKMTIWA